MELYGLWNNWLKQVSFVYADPRVPGNSTLKNDVRGLVDVCMK